MDISLCVLSSVMSLEAFELKIQVVGIQYWYFVLQVNMLLMLSRQCVLQQQCPEMALECLARVVLQERCTKNIRAAVLFRLNIQPVSCPVSDGSLPKGEENRPNHSNLQLLELVSLSLLAPRAYLCS